MTLTLTVFVKFTIVQLVNHDDMSVIEEIDKLKAAAAKQGIEIKFRNRKMPQGDFCIFIYDRKFRAKSYTVGYDGVWDDDLESFTKCMHQAYKWLDSRDSRYKKVGNEWIPKTN